MIRRKVFLLTAIAMMAIASGSVYAQSGLEAVGPVPNTMQLEWQRMEQYAFIHFSINTYTDQEWGDGSNDPKLFNPTELDCRQWARVCKESGLKGVILTAKHHDGFCLWPSKYTEYSVKNSPWREGRGDLVRELSDACREFGLKFGVYLSPWDRNRADYGHPSYVEYFRNQLTELLTNYGDVFEVWFDGANGGWGYYGGARENRVIDRATDYDWPGTIELIRKLQPNAIIWNEAGPDIRWCGNEGGSIGETNWSRFDAHEFVPGTADTDVLRFGREMGTDWVPGEVNVSIRPGWFYHTYEDSKVKSLSQLLNIYYNSVGRNATWLLNFPIDRRGLIHENDVKAMKELKVTLDQTFADNLARKTKATADSELSSKYSAAKAIDGKADTYWTAADGKKPVAITLKFKRPTTVNRLLIQEYIQLGQRVKSFKVEALVSNAAVDGHLSKQEWKELARETTIGYKRILRFGTVKADALRISIDDSDGTPLLSNVELYNAPQILHAPAVTRGKDGEVVIIPSDHESAVFYTLDGTVPTRSSRRYTGPVPTEGRVSVKAISVDETTGRESAISAESFDISHKKWAVISADRNAVWAIDGNHGSNWHQRGAMPADLTIDLGEKVEMRGFRYLPDQSALFASGFITFYEFYVSDNGSNWRKVTEGEFSNIRNNPAAWHTVEFAPVKARYVRLRAKANSSNDNVAGYSEFDIITN